MERKHWGMQSGSYFRYHEVKLAKSENYKLNVTGKTCNAKVKKRTVKVGNGKLNGEVKAKNVK